MEFAKLREILNTKLLFSYNKDFIESLIGSLIFFLKNEKYLSIYRDIHIFLIGWLYK